MGAKDKRKILVKFYGEKEVEAYSLDHARSEVESMKNLKPDKGISTMGYFDVFIEGLGLNAPALMTTVVSIFYVTFMFSIFRGIAKMEQTQPEMMLVGTLAWFMLLLMTIRWPRTVGRHFKRNTDCYCND